MRPDHISEFSGTPMPGDFLVLADGDAWILGEVVKICPTIVVYGDVFRVTSRDEGALIFRESMKPETRRLVGNGRMSIAEWRETLKPFTLSPATKCGRRFSKMESQQ